MNGLNGERYDRSITDAERELKALLRDVPRMSDRVPSQAYREMFAARTMARIARAEEAPQRLSWRKLWRPIVAFSTVAVAIAAFLLARPAEVSLDQVTAALPAETIQTITQDDAPIVPVGTSEQLVAREVATNSAESAVDLDAALAFADADLDQVHAASYSGATPVEPYDVQDLNDSDAGTVVALMQSSM